MPKARPPREPMGDEAADGGGPSRPKDLEERKLRAEAANAEWESMLLMRAARLASLTSPMIAVLVAIGTFFPTWESARQDRLNQEFQRDVALAGSSATLAAAALVVHGRRAVPILVTLAADTQGKEWPTSALVALDSLRKVGPVDSADHLRQLELACRRGVSAAYDADQQLVGSEDLSERVKLREELAETLVYLDALEGSLECALWNDARPKFERNYPDLLPEENADETE